MIAALLGWTKLPQWAMDLLALAAVALGVWYWHHSAVEAGVKQEIAAVQAESAKQTAALNAKINVAEHAHDEELANLRAYRDANPITPVSLCLSATPAAVRPANTDQGHPSAAPAIVQSVPAGDRSGGAAQAGPDIGPLLDALAARADAVSAELRSRQAVAP